ncbi:MAG: PEP-CTERM sorting domain-containing protein [Phycisphaerae bacterium]|nr:PEP-CTERM sorting domain-containing protein [Phycisphaerae bacterium]
MRKLSASAAVAASGLLVSSASAGVFQDVFRALDLLSTPSGAPALLTGDGTRVNGARAGRVRILPDELGNGYSLEFDRTFGQDSQGRPETFDLGPVDLTLAGDTQLTAGYTDRGFLIGNVDLSVNALNYNFRARSGAQNTNITGRLDVTNNLEINQFGFYNLSVNATNSGSTVTVDGVIQEGFSDSDFAIGPINIQGNIFVDGLAALLAGLGVDTSGLADLFPRSPIDQITAAIEQQLLKDDVATSLSRVEGFATATSSDLGLDDLGVVAGLDLAANPTIVPEPSGLLLLAGGAMLLIRRR